jgi:transcriptional regulator with GAF, ATPase, and Fis domain
LPAAVQAKLLRVLQEREIERLGGTRSIPIDARILAATNQDLRTCVAERRFREDLYYRLNVLEITLPPLRDRREDVASLADRFLHLHARRMGKRIDRFATDAAAIIQSYPWPGNVRELEHAVQRATILTRGPGFTVRVGDVLPGLGTVHSLAAHELVVRRTLTTAEQFDLLDRGKAVIDVVEMRFRSLAPMLVPGPTRP